MITRSILLLLFAFNAHATQSEINLQMMGYGKGITNLSGEVSKALFFRVPPKNQIKNIYFDATIRYSSLLSKTSSLVVKSGDVTLSVLRLDEHLKNPGRVGDDMIEIKRRIEIPDWLIQTEFLPIQFDFRPSITGEPCRDAEITRNLVSILPASRLVIDYHRSPEAINLFAYSLPQRVFIALPVGRQINEQEMRTLAGLEAFLARTNRTSVYVGKDSNAAQIALGTATELKDFIDMSFNANLETGTPAVTLESEALIQTTGRANRRVLLLNSSVDNKFSPFRSQTLRILNQKSVNSVSAVESSPETQIFYRDDLRIGSTGEKTVNGLEWRISISPEDTGRSFSPTTLMLSFMTPPSPDKSPVQFFIYENDELIHSITTYGKSVPQYFSVPLKGALEGVFTNIVIRANRFGPSATCGSAAANPELPIMLMPDTALKIGPMKSEGMTFATISHLFREGFAVHYPKALADPVDLSRRLGQILDEMQLSTHHIDFQSYGDVQGLSFTKPALVVTYDKTADQIAWPLKSSDIDKVNFSRLKSDSVSEIKTAAVLQAASFNGVPVLGLHLKGKASPEFFSRIGFGKENLIVFGEQQVLLRTLSERPYVKEENFSEQSAIIKLYDTYRYVFWGVIWLLLTFGFIKAGSRYRK